MFSYKIRTCVSCLLYLIITLVRQFFASVLEVVEVLAVAVGAVFLIRNFLVQPFLVSGSSMVPSFENGDYLLIDEITYRFRPPERGEVVVFKYPKDPSTYFIKRIIGLPGERVEIKNNQVTVWNARSLQPLVLDENYLPKSVATAGNEEFRLGPDEYLMLGDNRPFSFDSRSWGALNKESIVGLARLRLWPLTELRAFAAPTY